MVKTDEHLSATAYLLSQSDLISGLRTREPFSYGAYRTFQVPVRDIEELTGLSFGTVADADPLARERGVTPQPRELDRFEDALL
jgi:endonuclease G